MYARILPVLALVGACGGDNNGRNGSHPNTHGGDCGTLAAPTAEVDPVSQTAVHLSWTSETPGLSRVDYGVGGLDNSTDPGTAETTDHAVTLVGLQASQTYTVQVSTGDCAHPSIEVPVPAQPQKMPRPTVSEVDASRSAVAGGYLVMSTLGAGPSYVGIMDGAGFWVFWRAMDEHPDGTLASARARMSRDGTAVHYNYYHDRRIEDIGGIATVSLDGSVDQRTFTTLSHHDFVELPGGDLAWLGFDLRQVVVAEGPEPAPEDVGPDEAVNTASDNILVASPGATDADPPTEVMNLYDDYWVDPYWVCSHHTHKGEFVPRHYEWTHSNSIAFSDDEDAYYVLSRYLDALFKIDRASGEVLWQLGGADSDFTITEGEPFNHGHMSDVWPGGILVHDNRDHTDASETSRVVEYAWDEQARTYREVWSYWHPTTKLLVLGDAKRLPNGNSLIVWSQKGEILEVTPEGETVWRANFDLGNVMTRVDFVAELPSP